MGMREHESSSRPLINHTATINLPASAGEMKRLLEAVPENARITQHMTPGDQRDQTPSQQFLKIAWVD